MARTLLDTSGMGGARAFRARKRNSPFVLVGIVVLFLLFNVAAFWMLFSSSDGNGTPPHVLSDEPVRIDDTVKPTPPSTKTIQPDLPAKPHADSKSGSLKSTIHLTPSETSFSPMFFEKMNVVMEQRRFVREGHLKSRSLRVLSVFGTRPEAIKMAPIVWEFDKRNERRDWNVFNPTTAIRPEQIFNESIASSGRAKEEEELDVDLGSLPVVHFVCVTGQHRQMIDPLLNIFGIVPDIDLGLMLPSQTQPSLAARALTSLEQVMKIVQPDVVMVQGDTTTAMVAGLAAFYFQTPIAHVEAGLRTHDLYKPFPEEMNRHVLGTLSKFHFAPTNRSRDALLLENVPPKEVYVTGNTVIDTLFWVLEQPPSKEAQQTLDRIQEFGASEKTKDTPDSIRYILVTAHRRESFGAGMENICNAIRDIVTNNPDVRFIFPVHLNPAVQEPVNRILGKEKHVILISPPPAYETFTHILKHVHLILTDSGGIQEEATALAKPTLVMRHETERMEGVEAGIVKLVGTSREVIVQATQELLDNANGEYDQMAQKKFPYGDGTAARKIVDILLGENNWKGTSPRAHLFRQITRTAPLWQARRLQTMSENSTLPEVKISVVMPTHNNMNSGYLSEAVSTCLQKQEFKNFELIIVNDASDDNGKTKKYLRALFDSYKPGSMPLLRVEHLDKNLRLPKVLNHGFSLARGELMSWISDDNRCTPQFLSELVPIMEEFPEIGFVYSDFWELDSRYGNTTIRPYRGAGGRYGLRRTLLGNGGVSAFIYRSEALGLVGDYRPDLEGVEDWNYFLRLSIRYPLMGYVPKNLHYYRLHDTSMTSTLAKENKIRDLEELSIKRSIPNYSELKRHDSNSTNDLDQISISANPWPLHHLFLVLKYCVDQRRCRMGALLTFGQDLVGTRFGAHKTLGIHYLRRALDLLEVLNDEIGETSAFQYKRIKREASQTIAIAYAKLGMWKQGVQVIQEIISTLPSTDSKSVTSSREKKILQVLQDRSGPLAAKLRVIKSKPRLYGGQELEIREKMLESVYDNVSLFVETRKESPRRLVLVASGSEAELFIGTYKPRNAFDESTCGIQVLALLNPGHMFDEVVILVEDSPTTEAVRKFMDRCFAQFNEKSLRPPRLQAYQDQSTLCKQVTSASPQIVRLFSAQHACTLRNPPVQGDFLIVASISKLEAGKIPFSSCLLGVNYMLPMHIAARNALLQVESPPRPDQIFMINNRTELTQYYAPTAAPADLPSNKRVILHLGHSSQRIPPELLLATLSELGNDYFAVFHGISRSTAQVLREQAIAKGIEAQCQFVLNDDDNNNDASTGEKSASDALTFVQSADVVITGTDWPASAPESSTPEFGVIMAALSTPTNSSRLLPPILLSFDVSPINEFVEHLTTGILLSDKSELTEQIRRACTDQAFREYVADNMRYNWGNPFSKHRTDVEELMLYRMFLRKLIGPPTSVPATSKHKR